MKLHIKLSSTLRKYVPDYNPYTGMEIETSSHTPAELAASIGIPLQEIKFVMINGRHSLMESSLNCEDRVAFFPAIGGG